MAVVLAMEKWRPYLLGRHFVIKTDHFSLKYLLGQRITTAFQSKWLPKLIGYDYEIIYRHGKENVVADGLLRVDSAQLLAIMLSTINSNLMQSIKDSRSQDSSLQTLVESLSAGQQHPKYTWVQGILYRRGKIVAGNNPVLKQQLLQLFHDSAMGRHSSVEVTKKRLASVLY